MHRPDDEFINQFRERFGDLLLTCQSEIGKTGAHIEVGDSMVSASHTKGDEPTDVLCTDTCRTLMVEESSPKPHTFHALELISPTKSAQNHETFHNHNPLGSGAIFHNKAGDIHSPMIPWNVKISPFLDERVQDVPQLSWNGSDCFTPLAGSQRWLYDNSIFGQTDDISRDNMRYDSGYAIGDIADQENLADSLRERETNSYLALGHANEKLQYSNGEKYT